MRKLNLFTALSVCLLVGASAAAAAGVLGGWFWKAGYYDYAPEGVPDFDQKQDAWFAPGPGGDQWTYCGPVAALDSLWWFDSRYETNLTGPFLDVVDNFPLLEDMVGLDDHDPANVIPYVDALAWYMDTDGLRTGDMHRGTRVDDMVDGLRQYFEDKGLGPMGSDRCWFEVVAQPDPSWGFICEEVRICHDVVLLLGFWQEDPERPGYWNRLGGHYVTVAGVDPDGWQIAISDPFLDMMCWNHPPGHPPDVHNDAQFVAHDIYTVMPFAFGEYATPEIAIEDYPWYVETPQGIPLIDNFLGQNPSHFYMDEYPIYYPGFPVIVKVEYAIKVWPNGVYGGRVLDWAGWHLWSIFGKTPWIWPDDFWVLDENSGELKTAADAAAAGWLQVFIYGYTSTGYVTYPGAVDPYLYPGYGYWVLTYKPRLRIMARYDLACGRCCWWRQGPIIPIDHSMPTK